MKYWIKLSFIFFFGCASGQGNESSLEFQEIIQSHTSSYPINTQLSIALINGNDTQYVGILKTEDGLKSIDNHQYNFEIGSITKVFTSTLLASLIFEGKLQTDQPLKEFFNTTDKAGQITLEQLSNHTSGLHRMPSNFFTAQTDDLNPYKDYGEARLKDYLEHQVDLSSNPGENYSYSNLGTGILGYIITITEDKSFEEIMSARIFDPLSMHNTTLIKDPENQKLVSGLNANGQPVPNWDFKVLAGAGAILSTSEDMVKFAKAQLSASDDAMVMTQKRTFRVNDNLSMGMGWHILNDSLGTWHWHNGGTGGYRSIMALDLENEKGIVLLSNVSAFHQKSDKIDELGIALLKTLYEE